MDLEHLEEEGEGDVKTVADVMSHELITTRHDTPVLRIDALMVSSGIHHVPVVEDGRLIGMVGRGDIYRAILKKYCRIGE